MFDATEVVVEGTDALVLLVEGTDALVPVVQPVSARRSAPLMKCRRPTERLSVVVNGALSRRFARWDGVERSVAFGREPE